MSPTPPPDGGNFFESMLGDLLKLVKSQGPVNWELARQLALGIATGGEPETNIDPLDRIRLEELARIAELHVGDATGLATTATGRTVGVVPVTRGQWAWHSLEAWKPLLETMAESLSAASADQGADQGPTELDLPESLRSGDPEQMEELLGNWAQAMGPMLLALQFGTTIGHLAERAFGQYHLPVPRPEGDEILVVPANVSTFAEDWSLPADDVTLWVCLNELAHHSVLSRPAVRDRLSELLLGYVTGFRPDPAVLESKLADLDPSDMSAIQATLGNPSALLGDMRTPEQERIRSQLEAVVDTLEGYVDHVLDTIGGRLVGSYPALSEAMKRRRVERGAGERLMETLFGLTLGQTEFDRGAAFVEGVVERAGSDALVRLWADQEHLPTPAEVDAPGLWLERINLPPGH
jgi:putative hydrolase